MKRLFLIIICCLFLSGCKAKEKKVENILFEQYRDFEDKLDDNSNFRDSCDEFTASLVINKVDENEYRYDVIIDSPTVNMYHLQAIAKVEGDNGSSLPTLGILENEVFSLIPGVVDKANGIYKGVNLSGISDQSEFSILVYVTFSLDQQNLNKVERYIKLYGNASR